MDNSALTRLQQQNLEAEISVLGSLMLDKDAIIKIADVVTAEDFYDNKHKTIYEIILQLFSKNTSIDILTVTNALEENKLLDKVGGASYLTELINAVPTASNVVHYAFIVRKKGTLRRLIQASGEISNLAYNEGEDIEDVLDQAEQKLFGISQKHLKQNFIPINTVLSATFERIDELHRDQGRS